MHLPSYGLDEGRYARDVPHGEVDEHERRVVELVQKQR